MLPEKILEIQSPKSQVGELGLRFNNKFVALHEWYMGSVITQYPFTY